MAAQDPQGSRPVVLYHATQHAREWIAVETNRRLFEYVLAHKNDAASGIPQLLATTELWFIPVVNPDGYDYTFVSDGTRLWRKYLRDNNGDGAITTGDGVDTNRNWPTKWRFDPEGASDNPASETYRGPSASSEPEVTAYRALMNRLKAKFMIDYHSFGELILYPEGWQVETRATDDPILEALAGHDENNPAIPGYDPDLSAELYTVNGDITDDALHVDGTQPYTVELTAASAPPSAARTERTPTAFRAASSSRIRRPRSRRSSRRTSSSPWISRAPRPTPTTRSRTSATRRRTSCRMRSQSPTATRSG